MSGRSTGMSNQNSTTKGEMPAELISHRERRRRLFGKAQGEDKNLEEDKNLAAGLISYREYISLLSGLSGKVKGRERESPQTEFSRLVLGNDIWQGEEDVLGMDVWQTGLPKSEVLPMRVEVKKEVSMENETPEPEVIEGPMGKGVEKEVGTVSVDEHDTPEPEVMENDQTHWMSVSQFCLYWNERWSVHYGSFEDITKIPPMRFTSKPVEKVDVHRDTLQIFSVKLAATRGGLELPLDVFGMVAVRDPVDHNRNIIFHRKRDDCQTLTEKDPYLVLAGPTRAVMFALNPTIVEVDLKVKGATESKDVHLSFLVEPLKCYSTFFSHLFDCAYTSKLSTLEFAFGHITFSVEATIFVRVVHGSWPDGVRGLFAAFTTGFTDKSPTLVGNKCSTGTGNERIILLDSGGEKLPVAGDGVIKFSRRVVSVEGCGHVKVQVNAFKGETEIVKKEISFEALEASKSIGEIDIFGKMEVTVFWSLISCYPLGKDELVSTPLEGNGTDASC